MLDIDAKGMQYFYIGNASSKNQENNEISRQKYHNNARPLNQEIFPSRYKEISETWTDMQKFSVVINYYFLSLFEALC